MGCVSLVRLDDADPVVLEQLVRTGWKTWRDAR